MPTLILAGAMRSGTTSLARLLGAHPDVFMAPAKELHFFDRNFERGTSWYRDQFGGWHGESVVAEATPAYMASPQAIDRLSVLLPDVRLVVSLRNPIDRAYSHYWQKRAGGREFRTFEQAVDDELENPPAGAFDEKDYVRRGVYAPQLEHIFDRFPRERVHVIFFESFSARPNEVAENLFAFIGVGLDPTIDAGPHLNEYTSFRSLKLRRLGSALPTPVAKLIARANQRHDSYPPMEAATRRRLRMYFANPNADLSRLLGLPSPIWE